MSKRTVHTTFGGIILIVVNLACSLFNSPPTLLPSPSPSAPKLPNYGVFLIQGESFVELKQYAGEPSKDLIRSEGVTTPSSPVFWVWYPEIDLKYFSLVRLDKPGLGIEYKVTPRVDDNQILEIRPSSPLTDDIYCLYQGDPLGNPYSLPFWCFQVESNLSNNTDQQSTLDPQAISFREKVLSVMQKIETIEYDYSQTSNLSGPVKEISRGHVKEAQNGSQAIIYFDNGDISEIIASGSTGCTRKNNSAWNCDTDTFYSQREVIGSIQSIPNLASGSEIISYNGIQCRSFFTIDSGTNSSGQTLQQRIEVCYDLISYYPVFRLFRIMTENEIRETRSFNFRFNEPIEIVIPTPE